MIVTQYAHELLQAGICAIPCKMPDKRPDVSSWTEYQKKLPKIGDHYFKSNIGIITGSISGLIVIDFDLKYDTSGTLWDRFKSAVPAWNIIETKVYIQKTINNGYHIFIKTQDISSNRKIANRPATEDELKASPHEKTKCIIETRENGGFIVLAPTPGYEELSGSLLTLNELSQDELSQIFEACFSFNEVHEKIQERGDTSGLKPWDDFNKQTNGEDILSRNGWTFFKAQGHNNHWTRPGKQGATSGTWSNELSLFYCFTSSTELQPGKAYTPYALFTFLECAGDFSLAAKKLYKDGFGDRVTNNRTLTRTNTNTNTIDEPIFYSFHPKTGKCTIIATELLRIIYEKGGFGLYYYNDDRTIYRLVRVTDGFVYEATSESVKKFVIEYINTTVTEANDVIEAVHQASDKIFSKSSLEFLPAIELHLLTHTQTIAYYPFLNGVLCVEANKPLTIMAYNQLGRHVWRSHVINFKFKILETINFEDVEYAQFLGKICGGDEHRFRLACSLIGYLLHGYKDPARPYAVILAEEMENEEDGGGTGKGIFFRAIGKIIKTLVVDGKAFKHDKPFLFQRVDPSTQLVVIDDCRKAIDFQGFYSHISEGLTVEKKNRDEIHIPYAVSPKFLFSTNYTINLDGQHGKRRAKVLEFSPFFNANNTPLDFFGHLLFESWGDEQWQLFYCFMFLCVHDFIVDGIPVLNNSHSIIKKEIALRFGKEFLSFWAELKYDTKYMFGDLYHAFLNENEMDKKEYSMKRFKAGVVFAAAKYDLKINERIVSVLGGKKEFILTKKV
jgi:hypothetical protein